MTEKEKLEEKLAELIYDLKCTNERIDDKDTHHTDLIELKNEAISDVREINELKEKIRKIAESDNDYSKSK